MTMSVAATVPTSVPGLLLRSVRWPEEANRIADVNNTSRLAAGSVFVVSAETIRSFAGMVRPFINTGENACFGVSRGWCENISTRAPWRGRGVASALISRALQALRDRGMTQAALGVDAQNETGALRLYQAMGFQEVARETEWRRQLLEGGPTDRAEV